MRIALVFGLLLVAAPSLTPGQGPQQQSPSSPAWLYLTSSTDGKQYYYIPKTSYGDIREMWFKTTEAGSDKEIGVTLKRFDCESGASLLLQVTSYSRNVLIGTSNYNDSEWSYPEPDTIGAAWLNAACGQRKRDWSYVGSDTKEKAHFLKLGSLSRNGSLIRVWSKSAKGEETTSVSLTELDCKEGRIREIQTTTYTASGSSSTSTRPETWSYVVPGSMGETILKVACKVNRKPSSMPRGKSSNKE